LVIDKRLKMVVPDKYPRFVGYLDPALGQKGIDKALSIPGVSLEDFYYYIGAENIAADKRMENLILSTQKEKPEFFHVQAKIYLENEKGTKIPILSEEKVELDPSNLT